MHYPHKLFVYGTLKRGFYNHNVYLGKAEACQTAVYIGTAVTTQQANDDDDDALQLELRGPRNVPALFRKRGSKNNDNCLPIRGEVYHITEGVLQAMDILEGVATGFYYRTKIPVALQSDDSVLNCWVYLQKESSKDDDNHDGVAQPTNYAEYTTELHARYIPPTVEPNPEILKLLEMFL